MATRNNLEGHLAWFKSTRAFVPTAATIPYVRPIDVRTNGSTTTALSNTPTELPKALESKRPIIPPKSSAQAPIPTLLSSSIKPDTTGSYSSAPRPQSETSNSSQSADITARLNVDPVSIPNFGFSGAGGQTGGQSSRAIHQNGSTINEASRQIRSGTSTVSIPNSFEPNIQLDSRKDGPLQDIHGSHQRNHNGPLAEIHNVQTNVSKSKPARPGFTSFGPIPEDSDDLPMIDLTEDSPPPKRGVKRKSEEMERYERNGSRSLQLPVSDTTSTDSSIHSGCNAAKVSRTEPEVTEGVPPRSTSFQMPDPDEFDEFGSVFGDFDDSYVNERLPSPSTTSSNGHPQLEGGDFDTMDHDFSHGSPEVVTNPEDMDPAEFFDVENEFDDEGLFDDLPGKVPISNHTPVRTISGKNIPGPVYDFDSSPTKHNAHKGHLWNHPWSQEVKQVMKETFKLKGFRENQLEAINATLSGDNAFVLMPTGGGKSLCYQLPAIIKSGATRGVTVVISPLLSLMQDQVDHLLKLKIKALLINGETPGDMKREVLRILNQSDAGDYIQLLYVTPEMMTKNQALLNTLKRLCDKKQLARLVIDEAHCVSQWGHDFRPDYKAIGDLKRQFLGVPTIALTATATENVKLDVMHNLDIIGCQVFSQSFNRENLTYEVQPKGKASDVMDNIASLIQGTYKNQTGIIYCLSRKNCEKVAEELRTNHNIKAAHYHAGMDTPEKTRTQKEWQAGQVKIIVATIAFGMGIDKPDVRFVIHYTIPKSLEGYYQETGRAGRDNNKSGCYLFYAPRDATTLRRMIMDGDGNWEQKERQNLMLQKMIGYCENKSDCRRSQVLEYFNERFDKSQCNGSCDNCKSDSVYEKCDMTDLAKAAIRIVRAVQDANVTLAYCVDVFRGSRIKKVVETGGDQLEDFGAGKGVEKGNAERIFNKLISESALVEATQFNRGGFPQSFLKTGKNASRFLSGPQKLELELRTSPVAKRQSASTKFTKGKAATKAPVVSVEQSSPLRPRGRKQRSEVISIDDDSDAFEPVAKGYVLDGFVVPDSDIEEVQPPQRAPRANIIQSMQTKTNSNEDKIRELRENAEDVFVIEALIRCKQLQQITNTTKELCSERMLRHLWAIRPQTMEDMQQIEGVNQEFAVMFGYEFTKRINDSHVEYEKNRDEITRNVHNIDSDDEETSVNEKKPIVSHHFSQPSQQPDEWFAQALQSKFIKDVLTAL
jgi:RecQ family ATP-dependent DNA helicase